MTLSVDPEVLAELAPLLAAAAAADPPAVGDVAARRASSSALFERLASARPTVPGVSMTAYGIAAQDGSTIPARWYTRDGGSPPGSAVLYLHGGGMILSLEQTGALYDAVVRGYVAATGVPMLMVDYRVAPEFGDPVPVHDCLAALRWLADHTVELGVDPTRIAVMGDSAGGGLAAGVCLAARDGGGPAVAAQLLIYPMLDDRTVDPDPLISPFLTWTYDDNVTGWRALLGDRAAGPYAAPARADDLTGLPPAYLDIGALDVFRSEVLRYADRLATAGVPVELHLHPGCPHASEMLAPNAGSSRRAISDRVRRLLEV
jgi:acetyl esterase/lipase